MIIIGQLFPKNVPTHLLAKSSLKHTWDNITTIYVNYPSRSKTGLWKFIMEIGVLIRNLSFEKKSQITQIFQGTQIYCISYQCIFSRNWISLS
jgi:hypothetical protein